MQYEECLQQVKNKLINYTETNIEENQQDAFFNQWIDIDCGHEFGHKYVATFKEFFGNNITDEDVNIIFTTGNQVGFLLRALVNSNISQSKMIRVTKMFVSAQIDDFVNWCGDVCMRMAEDEDDEEDEEEINDPK
jgi:hypothetical protein